METHTQTYTHATGKLIRHYSPTEIAEKPLLLGVYSKC